jgi:DNA-binding Lrp family transcriptional regulator
MRDSKRSDRELARLFHVSQPTVTRIRAKLEKTGYIKQYTLMPDFSKLGYKIMAITFVKVKGTISPEEREKARILAKDVLKKGPYEIVMGERGIGLGYDGVFISYHQSFSDYAKLKEWFRQFAFLEVDKTDSFLIDMEDPIHYRPLDFTSLAHHLITKREKEE